MNPNALITSATSLVLGGFLSLLARLPTPVRRGFAELTGWLYARLARDSRHVAITNIDHARAGLAALGVDPGSSAEFVERSMRGMGHLLTETAICWRGRPGSWRALIASIDGEEALDALRQARARQSGGPEASSAPGVLLLSPHLGNWELLNMYLGDEFGLTVLYDPPKIAALDPLIRSARERTSSTVLPIGPRGLRGMLQQLRGGGVVGLLPDQVPAVDAGVYAAFLGKQALTINLVHRLANKHAPRVFLVCGLRNADGLFDIRFDELTENILGQSEEAAAEAMNRAIEAQIARAPEQYQWSYKRYKRPQGGGPSIYNQGAGGCGPGRGQN